MKDQLEAILFAAGRFVDEDHMAKLLNEDVRKVRKGLKELQQHYEQLGDNTCLKVVQEGKSWKIHVKDKYLELVSKLVSDKEIATTVLETLAIIAWRNPAMQAELIKIRGPAAYEHVTELLERGFITKEPLGRSFQLKVTDKFYEYFDVEGRDDLKALFKGVEQKAAAQQAEVEAQQQEYEVEKKVAQAQQEAIEAGKELTPEELEKLRASLSGGKAHSAQDALLPDKTDVEKVVAKTDALAKEMEEDLDQAEEQGRDVDTLRKELDEFKDDVETLKKVDEKLAKKK